MCVSFPGPTFSKSGMPGKGVAVAILESESVTKGSPRPIVPTRGGVGVLGQDHLDLHVLRRILDDPEPERGLLVAIGFARCIIQGDDQRVRPRGGDDHGQRPPEASELHGLRIGQAEREPPLEDPDRARDVPR